MIRTILILLFTLVAVPLAAFYFGSPLSELQSSILERLIYVFVITSLWCFVTSELSGNYSQTDKLWSIMPIIYAWLATYWSGWGPQMILISIVISVWGLRLTFNFGRRGGYHWKFWEGEEDYRWAILQTKPHLEKRWVWSLFNFFFISFYQHALILLFTLPILLVVEADTLHPNTMDYGLAALGILIVVMEAIADQQQWNFQRKKHALIQEGKELVEPYKAGFVQSGLWSKMRHPNYTAEQSFWLVIYLFSVSATGQWLNWSITGALLLLILFQKSSEFSEEISASKYPAYKDYQKRVGRFIPGMK